MYICPECKIGFVEHQLQANRCPVSVYHKNKHQPLIKVDDDLGQYMLKCMKAGYSFLNENGGARYGFVDDGVLKVAPRIPHITFRFYNAAEAVQFCKKLEPHYTSLLREWDLRDISGLWSVQANPTIISANILSTEILTDSDVVKCMYSVQIVAGGQPCVSIIDRYYLGCPIQTPEMEEKSIETLIKFQEKYWAYCQAFFSVFDLILAK